MSDNLHPVFQQALKPFAPEGNTTDMVQRCMDHSYGLGIDHAIETVERFLIHVPGLSKPLVEKLKKLKQ